MALLTPAFAAMAQTGTPSYPRSAKSSAAAAISASRVAAASRRQSRRFRVCPAARLPLTVSPILISTVRLVNCKVDALPLSSPFAHLPPGLPAATGHRIRAIMAPPFTTDIHPRRGSMKAAIFHGPHKPLTIENVEIDKPMPNEVLVRVVASGVCHSDLHFVDGYYPFPEPAILGHEAAGIVEAVGPMVDEFKPGDHVIACLSVFCGRCDYCLTGRTPITCSRPVRT